METVEVLHMNKGVGEKSYAMNSGLQDKIISVRSEATKKAIEQLLGSSRPVKMGIADLGCSTGPNVLRVVSEIVDVVDATSRMLDLPVPELALHLNDLFTNDFNTIFHSLPSFYKKLKQEKGTSFGPCFVFAVPGSFCGRLFPTNTLHFVHSSSSLNWLSQTPAGLVDDNGIPLNKGKIYISKSSPQGVLDAYYKQFQKDFTQFIESRSQEIVPGGRMVLSLIGRESVDPTNSDKSCHQSDLIARALMSMVSEGLVEEEKVDSFNAPYYGPCIEEMKEVIEKEGSFMLVDHEACEVDWDSGKEVMQKDSVEKISSGDVVARTTRATFEAILQLHFGSHIIDELFRRHALFVDDYLSKARGSYINLVISLVKRD